MKGEYVPRTRFGVQAVGVAGLRAGGLISEGQGAAPIRQAVRQPMGVFRRLGFHPGQGCSVFLGLDDAGGFAVNVQEVIRKAMTGLQGKFTNRYPPGRVNIRFRGIAYRPARLGQQAIDPLACCLFRMRRQSCPPLSSLVASMTGPGL